MNRRTWVLIGLAGVLGLAYVYFFSGLFDSQPIHVFAQLRREPPRPTRFNGRTARPANAGVFRVVFTLDNPYQLTSIQVFSAEDLKFAGGKAKPLWSVAADPKNPQPPIEGFKYGNHPRGMKPTDPANPMAVPLLADTPYTLLVEAGGRRGRVDFTTRELPRP